MVQGKRKQSKEVKIDGVGNPDRVPNVVRIFPDCLIESLNY
jgi:hypothetical protein